MSDGSPGSPRALQYSTVMYSQVLYKRGFCNRIGYIWDLLGNKSVPCIFLRWKRGLPKKLFFRELRRDLIVGNISIFHILKQKFQMIKVRILSEIGG